GIGQGGLNTGAANGAIQGLSNAGMGPGFGTYQTLANSGLGPSGAGYSGLANGAGATGAANQAIHGLTNANLGPAAGVLGSIAQGGGYDLGDIFNTVRSSVQPAITSLYEAAGRTPTGSNTYAENLAQGLTQGFAPYALQAAQQGVQNQLSAAGQLQGAYGQQL